MSAKKSYADMIKEAIVALKDRTGSSTHAIKAHIAANHPSLSFAPVSFHIIDHECLPSNSNRCVVSIAHHT